MTMRPGLSAWLALISLLAVPPLAPAASAQPSCAGLAGETLRWIVPTGPGGGYDTYSRLLQPFLERELSTRIRIENRPDAGGIVGAAAIRDAAADGRTLGIINASGLLAASAVGDRLAPDPLADFTILASIVSNHYVMFSGRDSGITDIDDLLLLSRSRPIVAGVRDMGSASFYAVPITAALLGFDYQLVTGYVGSAARTLALMRGEVDVALGTLDSVQGQVQAGELLPLLQLTRSEGRTLDAPQLAGPEGLARQRAEATGRSPEQAEQDAAALASIVGAGRLVVAPAGLPQELADCLDATLARILASPGFAEAAARAQLGIEPLDGEAAQAGVKEATFALTRFEPLIRAAIEQARE